MSELEASYSQNKQAELFLKNRLVKSFLRNCICSSGLWCIVSRATRKDNRYVPTLEIGVKWRKELRSLRGTALGCKRHCFLLERILDLRYDSYCSCHTAAQIAQLVLGLSRSLWKEGDPRRLCVVLVEVFEEGFEAFRIEDCERRWLHRLNGFKWFCNKLWNVWRVVGVTRAYANIVRRLKLGITREQSEQIQVEGMTRAQCKWIWVEGVSVLSRAHRLDEVQSLGQMIWFSLMSEKEFWVVWIQ